MPHNRGGKIYSLWFVTTIVVSWPAEHQYCTFVSCFVSWFACSLSNENSDSKIRMHLLKYMCVCAGSMPKSPTCDRPMLELTRDRRIVDECVLATPLNNKFLCYWRTKLFRSVLGCTALFVFNCQIMAKYPQNQYKLLSNHFHLLWI